MEKPCESVGDVLKYVLLANSNRSVRRTNFLNYQSSRSHCIIIVYVTQMMLDDTLKESKLCFVDLAGSELHSGIKKDITATMSQRNLLTTDGSNNNDENDTLNMDSVIANTGAFSPKTPKTPKSPKSPNDHSFDVSNDKVKCIL